MRLPKLFVLSAALLVMSAGLGWGMGSGPHPHLLTELPPPAPASDAALDGGTYPLTPATAFLFLLAGGGALGLLLWAVRTKEKI
jgi:hypothetical protein